MAWVILLAAGLLEIVWAIAIKHTDGFTRLWPSVLGIAMALLSFVMLAISLKQLPVGTAYAVWAGVGAVGVAVVGILVLGESASLARVAFLLVIIVGVVGLRFVEGTASDQSEAADRTNHSTAIVDDPARR